MTNLDVILAELRYIAADEKLTPEERRDLIQEVINEAQGLLFGL